MPTVRGKAAVRAYMADIPVKMNRVLRGAAREGAKVFTDYIEENTPSEEVREGLRTRIRMVDGVIKVTIDVKEGWARSVGTWLEWGTDPHFISVDESQRQGRSVGRINRLTKENDGAHSLVIGGNFVGSTVFHPGARPHPTFRPAKDLKLGEAVAAAQGYINARVQRGAIIGGEGDAE